MLLVLLKVRSIFLVGGSLLTSLLGNIVPNAINRANFIRAHHLLALLCLIVFQVKGSPFLSLTMSYCVSKCMFFDLKY